MDQKRGGFKKLPKPWKGALFVIILVISIVALLSAGKALEGNNRICYLCHEMRPEIYTARASAHARISCQDCHFQRGKLGQWLWNLAPMIKAKVKETYYIPITNSAPLSSEVCKTCHNMIIRQVSPSLDLIVPHVPHQEKNIECLQCHTGLTHNQIAKRQLTIDGEWEKWSMAYVREIQKKIHYSVSMDDCIDCHKQRNGPLSCDSCHREIRLPEDHELNWETTHGKRAASDLQYCHKCHSNGIPHEIRTTNFIINQYVGVNTFCKECHLEKPKGHDKNWSHRHGAESRQKDCGVCHKPKQSNTKQQVVACIQCHNNTHKKPRDTHPVQIRKPLNFQECKSCHILDICQKCHEI